MRRPSTKVVAAAVLLVALVLAGVVSFYASSDPDGLDQGLRGPGLRADREDHAAGDGPLAGYAPSSSTTAALGRGGRRARRPVVLVLAGGVTYAVRRREPADEQA